MLLIVTERNNANNFGVVSSDEVVLQERRQEAKNEKGSIINTENHETTVKMKAGEKTPANIHSSRSIHVRLRIRPFRKSVVRIISSK